MSTAMAGHEQYKPLRLVPLASVAALLGQSVEEPPLEGRLFVGLPLPVLSGLPIHVNGRFEVSSNRRDLWSGSDMTGDGRQRSVCCPSKILP